jgi:hypothetical protein
MMKLPTDTRVKTNMLFEAMGWQVMWNRPYVDDKGNKISIKQFTWTHKDEERWVDLYSLSNMGLSWLAVEWVTDPSTEIRIPNVKTGTELPIGTHFTIWWKMSHLWAYSQEEAQAAWLDSILSLCIEAGRVELPEEKEDEPLHKVE